MTNEFLYTSKGKNDECYTPLYAVEPLLEFLPQFKDKTIWLPFDEDDSEFVKCFRANGYKIINSHINSGQDFYLYEPEEWDLIISNPPFTNKREIFKRALSFNKPFCLLMSLTWLNDSAPMQLFKDVDLQLLFFEQRIQYKNQGQASKINFSSGYFCRDFLPKQIIIRSLKNMGQRSLFDEPRS